MIEAAIAEGAPAVRLIGELRGECGAARINYGLVGTRLGSALAAFSTRGLCWLQPGSAEAFPAELSQHWNGATLERNDHGVQQQLDELLAGDAPVYVHMLGTEFQLRVWASLLTIPRGQLLSYGELARQLGDARLARAVGRAVGRNHIAWLVPCHRVVRTGGGLGGYRWGIPLKRLLLAAERPDLALSGAP